MILDKLDQFFEGDFFGQIRAGNSLPAKVKVGHRVGFSYTAKILITKGLPTKYEINF
jgi:hypothetical protein